MIDGLQHDDLRIQVSDEGGSVVVKWLGSSDSLEPSSILQPFFEKIADESVGKSLTIDMRDMQFMNSATVAPILRFIRQLDRLQVPTRLVYGGRAHWQRVHFNAMKVVVASLRHVQVELS